MASARRQSARRTTIPQKEVEHLWKCYQEFDTQEESGRQFAGFLKDMSFEEKMLLCGRKAEAAAYWMNICWKDS